MFVGVDGAYSTFFLLPVLPVSPGEIGAKNSRLNLFSIQSPLTNDNSFSTFLSQMNSVNHFCNFITLFQKTFQLTTASH